MNLIYAQGTVRGDVSDFAKAESDETAWQDMERRALGMAIRLKDTLCLHDAACLQVKIKRVGSKRNGDRDVRVALVRCHYTCEGAGPCLICGKGIGEHLQADDDPTAFLCPAPYRVEDPKPKTVGGAG